MATTIRSDSNNLKFTAFVKLLDADLKKRNGDEHAFYALFNGIGDLSFVILPHSKKTP